MKRTSWFIAVSTVLCLMAVQAAHAEFSERGRFDRLRAEVAGIAALLHLQQAVVFVSATGREPGADYWAPGADTLHVVGESIEAVIAWKGGMVRDTYETLFPMSYGGGAYLPARVETERLLSSFLQEAGCTQANLATLAETGHDEQLRSVAVSKLTDQAILAKVAVKDQVAYVRAAAVERLTDQTVLAKVAVKDGDGDVRVAAVGRLTDQTVLARVAAGGGSADACEGRRREADQIRPLLPILPLRTRTDVSARPPSQG